MRRARAPLVRPREEQHGDRPTRQHEDGRVQRQLPPAMRPLESVERGTGQGAADAAKGVFQVQHRVNPSVQRRLPVQIKRSEHGLVTAQIARNLLPVIILTMQLNFKILCALSDGLLFFSGARKCRSRLTFLPRQIKSRSSSPASRLSEMTDGPYDASEIRLEASLGYYLSKARNVLAERMDRAVEPLGLT